MVWAAFVKKLRNNWESNKQIPRIDSSEISHNSSLIYQKLQLINYCISKKKEWNQWKMEEKSLDLHQNDPKNLSKLFDTLNPSSSSTSNTRNKPSRTSLDDSSEEWEEWEDWEESDKSFFFF